jgi:hypothetical protein
VAIVDVEFADIQRKLWRLAKVRTAVDNPTETELALTIDLGFCQVAAIKKSTWEAFQTNQGFAVGTIAHELAHVEERLRFGPYPSESDYRAQFTAFCNYRAIWAEFFAEALAAPHYDQNHLRNQQATFLNFLTHRSELEIANHIGRMLGYAWGTGMNLDCLWPIIASGSRKYARLAQLLWPLFTSSIQNNEIPELSKIEESLSIASL